MNVTEDKLSFGLRTITQPNVHPIRKTADLDDVGLFPSLMGTWVCKVQFVCSTSSGGWYRGYIN